MINDARRKTSLTKYLPLTLFVRVWKGCVGFYCERELEIEHNCNILTPLLWPSRCVFLVLWGCSTGGQGPTLLDAGFIYCILSASSLDPNSSGPQAPSACCGFPYHISSPLELELNWLSGRRTQLEPELNSTGSSNSTELYNRSTPTRSLKSNV